METNKTIIAVDQVGFEVWANKHGGLPLTAAHEMTCGNGWFPATYHNAMTEIAWRAWANKAITPVAAPAASIETDDFKVLVARAAKGLLQSDWRALIAHIDAFVAQHYEAGGLNGYSKAHEEAWESHAVTIQRAEAAEASLARLVEGVEELARYDEVPNYSSGAFMAVISDGIYIKHADLLALLPAKAEAPCTVVGMADRLKAYQEQLATPAPAMGEELPPVPKPYSISEWPSNGTAYDHEQMMAYGRACMALHQPGAAPDQTGDIFDLIREWAHLPEGHRGDVARKIIGRLNKSYMAGVKDTRALIAATTPVSQSATQEPKWSAEEIANACVKAGLGILECNSLIVTLTTS